MLITFLGAPCSGKTTTAARIYAELKDNGYPAEFLPEQARRYIMEHNLKSLTDYDQLRIMSNQYFEEFLYSKLNSLIVCDSSLLNSLLYMTDEVKGDPGIAKMKEWATSTYGVVFQCGTVKPKLTGIDVNRVHTWEQSVALEPKVAELAKLFPKVHPLVGDTKARSVEALRWIYETIYRTGYANH